MTPRSSTKMHPIALALAIGLSALGGAQAQTPWPAKPLRLLVAGPAGGTADALARLLADGLQHSLGQAVIVESKPGASGAIAIQELKAKGRDGYTFLVIQEGTVTESPLAYKVSYEPFKDLKPLAQLTRTGLVLVANKAVPITNLQELISYGKAQKDGLDFASYSAGLKGHTSGMQLGQLAGLNMRHVGYKGSPPALIDLMGGHVPLMFDGLATSLPLIKSGKITPIAVVYPTRLSELPNVPTFTELGYPQMAKAGWFAVWSHPDAPPAVQQKLRDAAVAHFRQAPVLAQIRAMGMEPPLPLTSAEMTADLKDGAAKQAALLKSIHYQPE
ncbi:tripartite tricarboxylate transporter substrate binding protein [Acidovorax sp. CCYZU-2555]|uniref:Bug family tripartite tricarboxylate transporter substrate binding protein n=1 Tax=Acidovorax sp. CCYZU-2555 TaxID=2835042 RepID=UPI001BCEE3A7|nr:tripartite tricarboxylate transporter substrate binding protein [Acidovorax sp. CCYZU-2555]MBS7780708.1 tripartite tricarboxylate transporter substrate binding protein [Acidovorax sp. CCYZU-2555]